MMGYIFEIVISICWIMTAIICSRDFNTKSFIIWLATITIILSSVQIIILQGGN